jgi:hypothetical protein
MRCAPSWSAIRRLLRRFCRWLPISIDRWIPYLQRTRGICRSGRDCHTRASVESKIGVCAQLPPVGASRHVYRYVAFSPLHTPQRRGDQRAPKTVEWLNRPTLPSRLRAALQQRRRARDPEPNPNQAASGGAPDRTLGRHLSDLAPRCAFGRRKDAMRAFKTRSGTQRREDT